MNHGIYNKSVSRPRKSKFQYTPQPIYYDFSEFSDDDSQEYYEQTSMRQKSPVSKSWSSSSDASAQIRGHRFSDRSERPVSGSLRSRGNSDAGTMNKPRIPSELLNNQHFLKVTESEGKETLKIQETGSFLIRLSQNPSCFCTLMVKTEKGVASSECKLRKSTANSVCIPTIRARIRNSALWMVCSTGTPATRCRVRCEGFT